ncbi:PREDICTED: TBC1 domain family member 22A-like [Bison bison bison]|uniref:TBC1 domain family member 22A-like n=1 Tax=Bison bison bison TaxID=43346 RepID=A0A6P3GXH9_BISBB|nr:PREDICTED: TBC1 domain family member 22A-like [Bison bison bison]
MSPEALILQPKVTEIFERILFIWAIRHPASGYVQGINDLVTPFFVVFICEYIDDEDADSADISRVPEDVLRNVEADTYWCMSRLLDGIQDNYTFAQPGIQMKVKMLEELVSRIDEQVHRHLGQHEVRYLQFTFRWMNNLLTRELPLRCTGMCPQGVSRQGRPRAPPRGPDPPVLPPRAGRTLLSSAGRVLAV